MVGLRGVELEAFGGLGSFVRQRAPLVSMLRDSMNSFTACMARSFGAVGSRGAYRRGRCGPPLGRTAVRPAAFLVPRPRPPDHPGVTIEILVPTTRTLGGATRAILETLLGTGFQNIDPPDGSIEVEMMNVEGEEWAKHVPDDVSAADLGEQIKADRTLVRVRIVLRLGHFLLFPGFVVLCRPDPYEEFLEDPRARQIIGREALELARAFNAPELVVAGDAASDFLGTEATTWDGLRKSWRKRRSRTTASACRSSRRIEACNRAGRLLGCIKQPWKTIRQARKPSRAA